MAEKKFGDIPVNSKDINAALAANADGTQESYVGLGDDMLDFGHAQSFIDEGDSMKQMSIKLVNATASDQKIQFSNLLANLSNHNVVKEGVIASTGFGETLKEFTGAGDPCSIDKLIAYLKYVPMRVRQIKIDVSAEAQLTNPLKLVKSNLFSNDDTRQIVPSNYQDQKTTNTKTVTVDVDFILGVRHTLAYTVAAETTVTMTFFFGAALDLDNALEAKYNRCVRTAAAKLARH